MTAPRRGIGRRAVVAGLGGGLAARTVARAQPTALPIVGFVRSASFEGAADLIAAFRAGLGEAGFVEGQNVAIEFRSTEGHNDRLPSVVIDLLRLPAAVIFGNSIAALAAKAATASTPIVFASGGDPVREGLVVGLSRPGGNITGVAFLSSTLTAKQLELLRELLPGLAAVGVLLDATNAAAGSMAADTSAAAAALGVRIVMAGAASAEEIDAAFARFAEQRVSAILVAGAAFFVSRNRQIIEHAARTALPAIYENRAYVEAGGLMSYNGSITEGYRQAGIYVGRILRGARPGDLPVVLGTRVELVVNLRTARSLGLAIPATLLARADEVIE